MHGRAWLPALILVATIAQLAVAEFVPGIDRFANKAFGARIAAYPVLMLLVPAVWWAIVKRRRPDAEPPYFAFALVMVGFLIDTTGNTLNLYDTVWWWDDSNHFLNWLFLLTGIGLIIGDAVRPLWVLPVLITGLGSFLALVWELGEWFTFIRHGTELNTAYEDTLGDMTLGTCGALLAGLIVTRVTRATPVASRQP